MYYLRSIQYFSVYLTGTGSFPGPDNSGWKQERSLAPEAGRHRSSMSGIYILFINDRSLYLACQVYLFIYGRMI